MDINLLAISFDLSAKDLLERGIAVFFAVFLLFRMERRLKLLQDATNAQTNMFRECFVWLVDVVRRDKGMPPADEPGVPHKHARKADGWPGSHVPDSDNPTPPPPCKPCPTKGKP